jgi:lipid II:glycine glycyltransferase (peptidoglycan interpeptide bridge formation enzyme)
LDCVIVREIDGNEKDYWDEGVQAFEHVHPLNAYDWGKVRKSMVEIFSSCCRAFRSILRALLLLAKRLHFLRTIFYSPKADCRQDDRESIEAIHGKVLELANKNKAIFLRIDPNIQEEQSNSFERIISELKYLHLEQSWTFWNSPRDVSRIELDGNSSTDDLLDTLDRDTRRCIRKASKDGVLIVPAVSEEDLRKFYDIFMQFSVDKGFMSRGFEYQKKLWESYVARDRGRLFLAIYQGEVIGGLICILFGKKCLAMHMGTPYKYHKLHTSYAYVWESIRWAKEKGCVWYSFRGVGTTPTQEAFKAKFNPKVVPLVGYYDYPFKPFIYKIFYFAEFTLLPASWPLILRTRRLANRLKIVKTQ